VYDALYRVQGLLLDGRFADARAAVAALRAAHPGHRLAKSAALAWARATHHPALLLDAADDLLADRPGDPTVTLAKASALRELGRVPERLSLLEDAGGRSDADPLLMQSLAQMLLPDPDRQADADRLLRRSVRLRPHAAAGYFLLGSQRWEHGAFAEAADLYRFAACLDDREEQFADAYSRVTRATGQAPEALRLFQRRAARGPVPHPPAVRALFTALLDRDEPDQAFAALGGAIDRLSANGVEPHFWPGPANPEPGTRNPELADLLLFRAEMHAQFGRPDEAAADLAARPLAPTTAWHKAAARVARLRPDPAAALDHLRTALDLDPHWHDGGRLVAALTAETHGRAAARRFVAERAARFPFSYPAVRLKAELLSPDADDAAVEAVRALLDLCPHDAWAHRQMALVLADRKRDAEAVEHVRLAGEAEPDHPSQFAVLAHVHRRAGRTDSAIEAYRAAVRADVDHELAVAELISLSRGRKEKRRAARFVAEQLHRQPHAGDGLVVYRDQLLHLAAEDDRPELFDELHAELEKELDRRPDLWQAWSLLIQQLGMAQRLDEAVALAEDAVERFPLSAQLWADLARVRGAKGEADERAEALRRAVAAAPTWPPAAHELAEALADAGEDAEAVAVLERASARSPLDPATHAALADRLWADGRSEEALARACLAVRHDPGFEPAWRMALAWADRLDRPDEPVDLARELTQARPGDVRGWLKLARLLHDAEHGAEALAALDTAIRLDPKSVEAHDLKAERLAEMGKYDEAIEAARPAELVAELPLVLQGRAAWVEAKRGNYAAAIPPMQALVSVEPEYFWGWQQLAEWYNETGRTANYLEAASELCRLKPEHPLPLTMRGEAKLKNGDRPGGKGDLRDALRLAPQYAPAAAILFDACLADGEHRDARAALAVLQEHAGGPEVLVKQIQFACKAGDAEAALRTLAELAGTPGDGPPVLMQVVLSELDAAGWGERAGKVLRDAWQSGEPFHPWAPLYWLDTPDGEAAGIEDRLAAVDAVIREYPTVPSGYDRKAELLAQVGRYDEAAAVCRSPAVGDPPPVTLRGRAAWVEARRGNRAKAIALMKQAVADDPAYLWGWRNLAQWYDADGRHKECLEAAEHMVRLSPDDPLAYGYRGEARRIVGDRRGAKADFERAFELDPAFDAAGLHLINEQLEADEVEAAARTLGRLQEHATGPLVRLRAVQVAARQGNLSLARTRLRALAADHDATRGTLREAVGAFDARGWGAEADDELAAVAGGPDATPAAAAVWSERLIARDRGWEVMDALPGLFERNGPAGREAAAAYAMAMAAAGRPDQAAATVHRFADQLRADVESWAKAGAALAEAKSFALAASWLSDWKNRDGLEGWMLRPLADALRAQDRDAEASAVARRGLELGGPPAVRGDFAGWLALEAAVAGKADEAADLLRSIDQVGLPDGTKLVIAVAEAVVMVARAGPDGRAAAFDEAKDHLQAAAGACKPDDAPPGIGRWYRRATARLAADAGCLSAKLWATWQRLRPWVR
jgi:tetratricopeptide (TPR) repeat protein